MHPLRDLDRLAPEAQKDTRSYVEKLLEILGDKVACLAVYGSATGKDFVPRRSNVNLLAVVRELELPTLRSLLPLTSKRVRGTVVTPLFLTSEYVASSSDAFPIEFLEMKENHVVLYGEDLLTGVEVRPEDVRLECERELRGSLLRMRQAYLELGRSHRDLERLLHQALTSLVPVFRGLLGLKDRGRPRDREEVLRLLGETFGIDSSPMLAVHRDRQGDQKIGGKDAEVVLEQFLRELGRLARAVDDLPGGGRR